MTWVAILRKDLALELRTRQSVVAMALFSVTVFVLFRFGLDRDALDGSLASGVLWVTLLLATVLTAAVDGWARDTATGPTARVVLVAGTFLAVYVVMFGVRFLLLDLLFTRLDRRSSRQYGRGAPS